MFTMWQRWTSRSISSLGAAKAGVRCQRDREIALELAGRDEVVDQPATDAEPLGDRRLLEPLVQQMFEEHERVPSIHGASPT
jgi:hypothetical protein